MLCNKVTPIPYSEMLEAQAYRQEMANADVLEDWKRGNAFAARIFRLLKRDLPAETVREQAWLMQALAYSKTFNLSSI
jgi:hypothetical protein